MFMWRRRVAGEFESTLCLAEFVGNASGHCEPLHLLPLPHRSVVPVQQPCFPHDAAEERTARKPGEFNPGLDGDDRTGSIG
jgi:hypothetical protein